MHKNRPLLLVEDNPDDVVLTLEVLKENRISNEIVVARDGVEALDWLFGAGDYAGRDVSVQPQVIFLDLKLPKVDGIEVLRAIRGNPATAGIPVVVLTSSNEERDIVESYRLGVNSFVRKPVEFGEFVEAARELALCWLVLNQPPPATFRREGTEG